MEEQKNETVAAEPTQPEVGEAPDNVTPLKFQPRSLQQRMHDKQRMKAEKARQERRKQLLDNKVPEQLVDQILQQEEYNRLPIDQKVQHLQQAVSQIQGGISQAMRQMAAEMVALRRNQEDIADSFDVNLRMLERILTKLGVDEATQKAVLEDVTKEFFAEKTKQAEDRMKAAQAEAEKRKAALENPPPVAPTEVSASQAEAEFKKADAEATGIVSGS